MLSIKKSRKSLAVVLLTTLTIAPLTVGAAITSSVSGGGALTVTTTASESVTITAVGGQVKINGADPGSGPAGASSITSISVVGSDTAKPKHNTFNLSAVTPATFPNVTSVLIDGGNGDDLLIGSAFNDTILGGKGKDVLIGGPGNDTLDGGQATDRVEANGDVNFTITNGSMTGLGTDTLVGIESATLTGGSSANSFTVTGWTGSLTISGAGGTDTVIDTANVNYTLTNSLLQRSAGQSVNLVSIENATLTGGGSANQFTVSGWSGTATLNGAGGTDTVISSNNGDFTLDATSLIRSDGASFTLNSIEAATLTGGTGDNTFTVTTWAGVASFAGGTGSDTVIASADSSMTLTNSALSITGGAQVTLNSIEAAELTGGSSSNSLNATGFTGPVTLNGLGGNDTLTGGSAADLLLSFGGDDQLLGAGAGDDYLISILNSIQISDAGASGIDAVTVEGTESGDSVVLSATQLTHNGSTTTSFAGLESISVLLAGGDDDVFLTPSSTTSFELDGGPHVSGDSLTIDLLGRAYGQTSSLITVNGMQPIQYSNFETVDFTNLPTFPFVSQSNPANPNPTTSLSLAYNVSFSAPVTGFDASDLQLTTTGDIVFQGGSLQISGGPQTYSVSASVTGTNGTARLDVIDDDSIRNAGLVELGGHGTGNGNFTAGTAYVIDTNAPTVSSITRLNASPTNAATVSFRVTFSENVSGVDASDFALTTTGGQSGATIGAVTGGPQQYTVTVNTTVGEGTIRLDANDDDTITDLAGNALNGAGSTPFLSGETYTVDRVRPTVSSIIVQGSNPTNLSTVIFRVTFSEAVSEVDSGDFGFTLGGSVLLADIFAITGGPTIYDVEVDIPGSNDGTVRLDVLATAIIRDGLNNTFTGGYFSGEVLVQDTIDPSATIQLLDPSPSALNSVRFAVNFSEGVSPSFNTSNITVTGTLAAGAGKQVVGPDPNYVVTITPSNPNANGTIGIFFNDLVVDKAGNGVDDTSSALYTINNALLDLFDTDGDGFSDGVEQLYAGDRLNPFVYPTFGDINNDGNTDLLDAIIMIRGGIVSADLRFDINLDSVVNAADGVVLYNWASGAPGFEVIPKP